MRVAVTRLAAVWSIAASAGCFYVDPVNQRPSLDIRPLSSEPVFRGASVGFEAIASDPEKQPVSFQWRAYACTDALSIESCDLDPIFTGVEDRAVFVVPPFRADPDGPGPEVGAPVESLRLILEGKDDHGATARPAQVEIVMVNNHPPELDLRVASAFGSVVSAPIDVYAKYGDPDDAPGNVTLEWTVYSPSQVPDQLTEITVPQDPGDPAHLQRGVRFTPMVTGNWDLVVAAIDKTGARVEQRRTIPVVADRAPCLASWEPLASPGGPTPITEPTLFSVGHVSDDLDPFPRPIAAPDFVGEPAFEWSLQVGAGPRVPLENPVSSFALDPRAYAPGTVLELRVEIFDRKVTPITCGDALPTCSVIAQPSCIQRQTWRVEAR